MRDLVPQVTPYLRLGGREWRLPTALRALSHRNYRLWWFGQLVSLVGTWMQSTAQQWLVYRLTGSPLKLGTIMFASSLPIMLFAPLAGVAVDRADKRRLITATQTVMMLLAFGLAALTFSGLVQYWHVLIFAALVGCANTLDMPARQSFTVEMVGREDLMNAIALNSSIFNGARLIGPAAAGILVASVGESAAFGLNGLSFLAVIAGLLLMRLPPSATRHRDGSPLAELRAGARYIWGNRVILALIGMVAVPSLFGFPYTTLIPVFAGDILKIGPTGFGGLLSAIGLGALGGAFSLALMGNFRRKGILLTAGSLTFAAAIAAFAASRWTALAMICLVFAGWAMVMQLATTNTLLQTHVADEVRGRVMSVYTWTVVGSAPVGSLLIGAVAQRFSPPLAVWLGAAVCGAFALGVAWRLPQVRRLE